MRVRIALIGLLLTLIFTSCTSGSASQSAQVDAPQSTTEASEKNETPEDKPAAEALADAPQDEPTEVLNYSYEIINRYPHDPAAFTQGLIYADGIFYEGTGLYGHSTLRKVDPETGEVLLGARLPDEVFGEGITLFDGKIYQLTWREQTGYVIDAETFELLDTFTYSTEGWGLTHDGERLIQSDGSERLTFFDPATLEPVGTVDVVDGGEPVTQLNELEYIDGQVYANIWQTDAIVIIDPSTGQVTGRIDLSSLLSPEDRTDSTDVLNGIAYDVETDRLFVTGKLWPYLFEIQIVHKK